MTGGSAAGESVTVNAGVTATGDQGVAVNTPALNLNGTAAITANNNNVDVQSNGAGNALTVTMGNGSSINAASLNADVTFNNTTAGAITINNAGLGTINANDQVILNGGANAVAVDVNNINGCVAGSGTTFSVAIDTGNLNVGNVNTTGITAFTNTDATVGLGNIAQCAGCTISSTGNITETAGLNGSVNVNGAGITSTGGTVTLNAGANDGDVVVAAGAPVSGGGAVALNTGVNGSITLGANVSSTGSTITLTGGSTAGESVTVNTGVTVTGDQGVAVNTPALNLNGTAAISATNNNVAVQSNGAGNALTVTMGNGSSINAASATADVTFNNTTAGAITINNAGLGTINANDQVILNGGANAVTVDVNNINGCVAGSGTTFSVAVDTGNLNVGNVNTTGITAFTNTDATVGLGNIAQCAGCTISSTSNITETAGLNGSVNVNGAGITSTGGTVTLNAGTNDGDVTVSAGAPVSGSGAVAFNTGANGSITIGADVSSTGSTITLTGGSAVGESVTVSTGVTATGNQGVAVNTPALNLNGTAALTATNNNVDVQSNGAGNALTVTMGNGSSINAASLNADVTFNNTTAGAITINNAGLGTINANDQVILNGGANAVSVDVNNITGCVAGSGTTFSVSIDTGNLNVGNVNTTGITAFTNTDSAVGLGNIAQCAGCIISSTSNITETAGLNGSVNVNGAGITSTGGTVTLNAGTNDGDVNVAAGAPVSGSGAVSLNTGANGSITLGANVSSTASTLTLTGGSNAGESVTVNTGVTATGNQGVAVNTPSLSLNGTAAITATNNNVDVQSNVAGNSLTVSMGNGSSLNATGAGGDITFNNTIAGSINISNAGLGTINANDQVILNGGANAVSVDVNNINGCVAGSGNTFSIAVDTGNLNVGNVNTTNVTTFINTDATVGLGNIAQCAGCTISSTNNITQTAGLNGSVNVNGAGITSTGGTVTLTAGTNDGDIMVAAGAPVSGSGAVSFNTGVNGSITASANVASTGSTLTLNGGSAAGESVTINTGATATGNQGVTVNTPALNLNGTGAITATNNNVAIQSNGAGNALTVTMGNGSSLNATSVGGDVTFNNATAGAITINNGGLGTINANDQVILNGGANAVAVDVNNINGCVAGSGTSFSVAIDTNNLNIGQVNTSGATTFTNTDATVGLGNIAQCAGCSIVAGNNVSLNAGDNGNVTVGGNGINATGAITLTAGTTDGNVTVNAGVSGGGNVVAQTGANGSVAINANTTSTGGTLTLTGGGNVGESVTVATGIQASGQNGVTVNSPVVNLNGTAAISSATGNVLVQSNGAGFGLAVNMGSGSAITSTTGMVSFNTTNPGAISIGGPNTGLISAGTVVQLYGGPGAVNVNVDQIVGCVDVNGSAITLQTQTGDINFCCAAPIDTSNAFGSGGAVTIVAQGGGVLGLPDINTSGTGAGNSAGGVSITSGTGNISVGNIVANGAGGANGGGVSLTTNPTGTVTTPTISATSDSGTGGTVTINTGNVQITNVLGSGASIDVSSPLGTGGQVAVTTKANNQLQLGPTAGPNQILGGIDASGTNGGRIDLTAAGGPAFLPQIDVDAGITLNTNGTTGVGGKIQFRAVDFGNVPLFVRNDGTITSTNTAADSGRIGFNGGPAQNVILFGGGSLNAGEFNAFGNLDPVTLDPIPPSGGTIFISQGSITGKVVISGSFPPVAPPGTGAGSASDIAPTKSANGPFELGATLFEQLPGTDTLDQQMQTASKPLAGLVKLLYKEDGEDDGELQNYIPGARTYTSVFDAEEVSRLEAAKVGCGTRTGNGIFDLESGNCVFAPEDGDLLVHTSLGEIMVPKGSVVFIMNNGNEVAVYGLHDEAGKPMTVKVANRSVSLNKPGTLVVLTSKDAKNFNQIEENVRWIGYRDTRGPVEHADTRVFVSEFSLPSALTTVLPLRHMRASKAEADKRAADKILKDAVILLRVGGPGQAYKSDRQTGIKLDPSDMQDKFPPNAGAYKRSKPPAISKLPKGTPLKPTSTSQSLNNSMYEPQANFIYPRSDKDEHDNGLEAPKRGDGTAEDANSTRTLKKADASITQSSEISSSGIFRKNDSE
ncbi:MAG: hypothetical protein K2W95_25640 [Candidatus Obscuribacterales bacterium]|nr:hypothetical protein [Candidatus Obscuribacterales bacterium]